jgi:hypothetical protein
VRVKLLPRADPRATELARRALAGKPAEAGDDDAPWKDIAAWLAARNP